MEAQDPIKVRLIEAAGEEFAGKGFECARIRTICDRAGANVAAVNYHFGDKEQLYVATVLEAHRCGLDVSDVDLGSEKEPAEQLRWFVHHFLGRVLAINDPDNWRHRLMLREMIQPTAASDILIRESIRPKFERLHQILKQFCPDADERRLNALAFSVIGQCLHYRMGRPIAERLIGRDAFAALDLDYLTDHITSVCLGALDRVPAPKAAAAAGVTATALVS